MSTNTVVTSVTAALEKLIDDGTPSIDNSQNVDGEPSDGDGNSDHFNECKGLSSEDFCKSIRAAEIDL